MRQEPPILLEAFFAFGIEEDRRDALAGLFRVNDDAGLLGDPSRLARKLVDFHLRLARTAVVSGESIGFPRSNVRSVSSFFISFSGWFGGIYSQREEGIVSS